MKTKSLVTVVIVLAAGTLAGISAAPASSVWDGVYAADQANRGSSLYQRQCASCHGKDLEGGGQTPPLAGDRFKSNWNGQSLGDLFERMRDTMPADLPGNLSADQNAEVLAWMLRQNGFPAGAEPMKGDAGVLKQIRFESVKPKK